ncbi:MAG: hypothetical protein JWP97_6333 [Labilithrix sp.]|nr:hypothetical protein [Labilithrix sp.]
MIPSQLRSSLVGLLPFAATLLVSTTAAAQSNYRLAPVGGRSTLVGGTGIVFGNDSSSAFLNPATVVRLDPGHLSFSANFYQLSYFSSREWYQPGAIDQAKFGNIKDTGSGAQVSTAGFDSLPGSLCIFLRVGELRFLSKVDRKQFAESQARLGICLATVQNNDFSLNNEDYSNNGARQSQTVRQSFRRIAVGPTYGMYVTNALAVGASVHLSRAGYRSIFESTSTGSGAGGVPVSQAFYNAGHGDSYDVTATVGATYRIGRYQTVGLTVEAPSLHIFGSGGLNHYTHDDGLGGQTHSVTADGAFAAYSPLRVALGTGVRYSWGTAELNASYHLPLASAYRAQLTGRAVDVGNGNFGDRATSLDLSNRAKGAVNFGVGLENYVAPFLSVLSGISTDLSTVPAGRLVNDPMAFFPASTNRVAGSLGVGSHGTGGSLLLGAELSYEWGNRLAVNSYQEPARFEAVSSTQIGLLFVIAGTTSFSAIKRAVNDITNAVDLPAVLTPKEEPANRRETPSTPESERARPGKTPVDDHSNLRRVPTKGDPVVPGPKKAP